MKRDNPNDQPAKLVLAGCMKQKPHMDVSKNRGTPKWMVYNGEPYLNAWFGGTTIFGYFWKHPHRFEKIDLRRGWWVWSQTGLGKKCHHDRIRKKHTPKKGEGDPKIRQVCLVKYDWVNFITVSLSPQIWNIGETGETVFMVRIVHKVFSVPHLKIVFVHHNFSTFPITFTDYKYIYIYNNIYIII